MVGSNIFNVAFILGISALVHPLAIGGNTIRLEYPVMALVTLLCVVLLPMAGSARLDAVLLICGVRRASPPTWSALVRSR